MKNSFYQKKYLKYKSKYLSLKNQIGGNFLPPRDISIGSKERYCYMTNSSEANCLNAGEYEFVNFGNQIGVESELPINFKFEKFFAPLIFNNLTEKYPEVKWFVSPYTDPGLNYTTCNYYLIFTVPQPFQSWTRDGVGGWVPPIPKQENDTWWNESAREWSTEPWLQQF